MRTLVYHGAFDLRIEDAPAPVPGPGDAIVQVGSVGICGSDLYGYKGQSPRRVPPLVMGHEVGGVVVGVGDGVAPGLVGRRVAINPFSWCGSCATCLRGHPNICERRVIAGVGAPGAFAELLRWPARNLHPVEAPLTFEQILLAEPLAVGLHGVYHHGRPGPSDVVVVLGTGMVGLTVMAVSRLSGAGRIIAVDLVDARLELARRLGADDTVNPSTSSLRERIEAETDGLGADVVFEAVGLGTSLRDAMLVARRQGSVVVLGRTHREVPVPLVELVTREIHVRGSHGYTNADFAAALDLIASGRVDLTPTVGLRAPLDDGPAVFETLAKDPSILRAVLRVSEA